MQKYILALDQGTTSSRSILFDSEGNVVGMAQKEFHQIFPQLGWVEHDPKEIWETQLATAKEVLKKNNIMPEQVDSIGISNQRETTIVWDKNTGEPIYNALVWQDKRTASICERLKSEGHSEFVQYKTGLIIDSYFSSTKIQWMLENVEGAMAKAKRGDLLFGTVDSWLVWKLTGRKVHATDYTNASRTMLYDIRNLKWDDGLLDLFKIPRSMLPEVKNSSDDYGVTEIDLFGCSIPITGVAGDQQASLFGQRCWSAGEAKNTYGTGCFMLLNTGDKLIQSKFGLISTIAIGLENSVQYALEGSVFIAGAAIQWLRDGLQIIPSSHEAESMAMQVEDNGGVFMVPAFVGLGAPHWDMYARGAIFGLTRGSNKYHLVRATLEALAYQTRDVLDAMNHESGIHLQVLKVDGGACRNNFLMQFQADILNKIVERPMVIETTALGAAYLAGIKTGFYQMNHLVKSQIDRKFEPNMEEDKRVKLYGSWQKALKRTMNWEV